MAVVATTASIRILTIEAAVVHAPAGSSSMTKQLTFTETDHYISGSIALGKAVDVPTRAALFEVASVRGVPGLPIR